ncbi:MAG: hypothetical protein M0036_21930 [Desulfobacteraceae bacterium]|nr:hypothetical protein [Desulfobacteraceae bacterium]
MSIRLLAKDLYRFQREVEQLEKELAALPLAKRAPVEEKLRQAMKERDYLKRALDGQLGR